MSKIPVNELISCFERMRDEHWDYCLNSAREGCVDCSGAFVWAYKQFDKTILHGSNSIARLSVGDLLSISYARPGMVAVKVKDWTDDDDTNRWYDSEPGNVYHIGLVIQNGSEMNVIEAKGAKWGVVQTKLDNKWKFVAYLDEVDYTQKMEEKIMEYKYTGSIRLTSGYVHLRTQPNITSKSIAKLYHGEPVEIGDSSQPNWYAVKDEAGNEGYVYSKYVVIENEIQSDDQMDSVFSGIVITDSLGNKFYPIGSFTVEIQTDSVD